LLRIIAESVDIDNIKFMKNLFTSFTGNCSARTVLPCLRIFTGAHHITDDTRRSMRTTTTIIAIIGGLALGNSSTAHAQPPVTDETNRFVNISVGGQFQTRSFSAITTFPLFDETGSVTANQTVGNGFVFDITGGQRLWGNFAGAIGLSTFNGSGSGASLAAIPNQLFRGQPDLFPFPPEVYGDLKQSTVAINFQIVWMRPLTDRFDLAVFLGPSVIRVKQELASATAEVNSVATTETESKTTAKAGTVGVDVSYQMTDRYGAGAFVRYAGGSVDLPSVPGLKVGGAQAGVGIRIGF
jgi:hypothetical protein